MSHLLDTTYECKSDIEKPEETRNMVALPDHK